MGAASKLSKGKIAAGATVACLGAAAAAVGIYYGVKGSDSSGLRGAQAGTVADPATVAKCGELQTYSTAASGKLDGTFTNFAYGPTNSDCCATDYACPYASVATYACDGGASTIYELQCCTKSPANGDFSSCGKKIYRSTVTGASNARALATGQNCESTGFDTVAKCSARPANKGYETLKFDSLLAPVVSPAPGPTPTTTPKPTKAPVVVAPKPTKAPVTKPTEAPVVEETPAPTPAPTAVATLPADEVCTQLIPPPGVKPGGCLEVTCLPTSVDYGDTFHVTARWCTTRPRRWHITFALLDINTKTYYGGEGWDSPDEVMCAEHTFKHTFKAEKSPALNPPAYDVMWKWYVTPVWGDANAVPPTEVADTFPNMLAEAGIAVQPIYAPLTGDCPVVPDRTWNLPATGKEDAIDFELIPECFTPGQDWQIQIKSHLESRNKVDFRVNMQIGTGGDKYLGVDDIFVAESPDQVYGMTKNTAAEYWTVKNYGFTAAQTAMVKPTDRVYVSAFMVPAGQEFADNNAWTIIDGEKFLQMKMCA